MRIHGIMNRFSVPGISGHHGHRLPGKRVRPSPGAHRAQPGDDVLLPCVDAVISAVGAFLRLHVCLHVRVWLLCDVQAL